MSETRFLIRRFVVLKSWGWMSHCNIWAKGPPELKLDDRLSRYIRQTITKFQLHSTLWPKLRACCVRNHHGHFQQARRDVTFFAALCYFLLRYVFLCEINQRGVGCQLLRRGYERIKLRKLPTTGEHIFRIGYVTVEKGEFKNKTNK